MADEPNEQEFVERCRTGDEKASEVLYNRYVNRLVALAQKRMNKRFAARFDAEDIVQSVFRSFFGRLKKGEFEFNENEDLWRLLARITVNKTIKQVDFHRRHRRDSGKEVNSSGDDNRQSLVNLLAAEPTPEETVQFMDELENFLTQLRPDDRSIIELRLQGYTNVQIAEKLDISDRTIRRLMERMRGLAEKDKLPF